MNQLLFVVDIVKIDGPSQPDYCRFRNCIARQLLLSVLPFDVGICEVMHKFVTLLSDVNVNVVLMTNGLTAKLLTHLDDEKIVIFLL